MGLYEIKHPVGNSGNVRRTCLIKPSKELCEECKRDAAIYRYSINCQSCERNNKRYELIQVGVGTGLFGADYAIVRDADAEVVVELRRVRDIREEPNEP